MLRIPFPALTATLAGILIRTGFEAERARRCAELFTETTCDGIYSHGVERFPRFLTMIENGCIDIRARPERRHQFGAIENWDGRRGVGNLNAETSMARAIELSGEYGIGCVALANTNHWMRGGSYGWQAAQAGAIGICWTNTMANLPPWGATAPAIGNNPLIIAVPRPGGPVVLDMAMSQFSYGALASFRQKGMLLPVDGGFDSEGHLTRDPGAIEASERPLPIGYWKGSGLAVVLDLVATLLSAGQATHQIPADPVRETGLSQVFLAIRVDKLHPPEQSARAADAIVEALLASGEGVRYPGQQVLQARSENLALGIPVREELWVKLRSLPGAELS